MSTTFIERLFDDGDAEPTGQNYIKVVGGLDQISDKIHPLTVDYQGDLTVAPALSTGDALGRFRQSNQVSTFDSKQVYEKDTYFWVESLTGAATATYVSNSSLVRLQCTTASGDVAIRQSRRYIPYLPGRSQLLIFTGVMGAIKANTIQRIGFFDANNGLFFEQNGTTRRVVMRSSVSGSPVDTAVNQADWNMDKLDGTGKTGATLDTTKVQAFVIDFAWLGTGTVRFGILYRGRILYCHRFVNENANTEPFMKTPSLPVRYELRNNGTPASSTTLDQICASATSEGGSDPLGVTLSANTGTTARIASTNTPIISIRLKSTYNRALLQPLSIDLLSTSNRDVIIELYIRAVTSGGSFVSSGPATEANITPTSVTLTNAFRLASLYLNGSTARVTSVVLPTRVVAAADFAGTTDEIVIVASDIAGGSSNIFASINFTEIW